MPTQRWRRKLHEFVIHEKFETFVMGCIILNMIQMMIYIDDIQNQNKYEQTLGAFNFIFATIFFIEAILKLLAFGATYF